MSSSDSESDDIKQRWLRELDDGDKDLDNEANRILAEEGGAEAEGAKPAEKDETTAASSEETTPRALSNRESRRRVNPYDTLRKKAKRVRRELSGEFKKPVELGDVNPYQVKANVAVFELQAAKNKQKELQEKMETLAQTANAQAIELEKAKEKLRKMEEEARRLKAKELEDNKKAVEEERKRAQALEEELRRMREEKEELERQKLELQKAMAASEKEKSKEKEDSPKDTKDSQLEKQRFEKEQRLIAEREKQLREKEERRRRRAEREKRKLEAEKEELERQKKLLRQRSGLEWFLQYYKVACKAQDTKPCAALEQIINRAKKKNKSIFDLDLFRTGIDTKGLYAINQAFRDTFKEIKNMSKDLELVNTIDPTSVNLKGNKIISGTAIVDLCLAIGSLQILDISENNLGAKGTMELAEALYNYKSLEVLHAASIGATSPGVIALLKALQHSKKLRDLDIGDNGANEKAAPYIAQLMESCPLQALSLRDNPITSSGMKLVVKAISSCPSLREFDFTNTGMEERVKDLMDVVMNRNDIQKICIGFNKLGGSSFATRWAEFVSKQNNLKYVDLRYINVGSRIRNITESLAAHTGVLTELILNGNPLDRRSVQTIAEMISSSKSLHRLALRCCDISPEGFIQIANSVKTNSVLRTLDLAGNRLKGKEALDALADCIQHNKALEAIGLAALKLDKRSIGTIARAVQLNSTLVKLHIGGNKLGEAGLQELANNLAGNEGLRILVIKDTDCTPKALIALMKHLVTRSKIQVIDATDNEQLPKTKAFAKELSEIPDIAVRW